MSFPDRPSEFPLPRAVHYDLVYTPFNHPIFKIVVVETQHNDGTPDYVELDMGIFADPYLFHELQDLYKSFSVHGGFAFSKDSIAMRLQSMDRVLCWFGFNNGIKYTCYVERYPTCASTFSQPSPESQALPVLVSNEPNDQ